MSLFSRLFRKSPVSVPAPAPSEKTAKARPQPSAADRALADDAEAKALRAAIDAGDMQAVAKLVVAGTSTKIRQAAAHAIEDPDLLRQLINDVRGGNDKNVYKVLTSKRDVLHEQARKLEQLNAEIVSASAALERHSQRAYDTLYKLRLDQFESRWNEVAAQADAELRDRVKPWIVRSHEIVAEYLREVEAKALREQAAAAAAAEAQRQREQRAQAAAVVAVEPAAIVEEQKPELTEAQQAEQEAIRQMGELIRKARAALGGGSTSRAAAVRETIEEKLAAVSPLPAKLASQLQQLDEQLDKLKDWKSFSVAPKRAELIEEIEALIGADYEPVDLADRITSLRDEWRILGKGAGENAEADSQRFQAAAEKAYEPCAVYFAAQALIRKENLQRRDALLAGLTAFEAGHNWERPDWQAVIKTLRETKQEWRNYSAVDRQAGKQQQDGFTALITNLQGRLDAEYARNLQQKQSLIERAQALLASDDSRKATDTIKQLQQQWQAVGPMPRDVDQRLWAEFRQHCDAVFQKRQQESAAFTAGLENNKQQAIALCEQIEQIATLEGAELLASAGSLGELRNAFESLGEFPRADTRELRNRLDQALDRCKKAVARQHARAAEHSWNDLFDAANHVRAYRLAVARGSSVEQIATLKEAAESFIASVQKWPKSGLNAIKQALAAESSTDIAANELALKMLCIRGEILTDKPTPSEDQALRRDYQLQRLAQRMGQGLAADETQWDGMVIEWINVGPVEDEAYQSLLKRFRLSRDQG